MNSYVQLRQVGWEANTQEIRYSKVRGESLRLCLHLQYIMGHADISVTLNTYTHMNFDDAKEEVYRIANI